MALVYKDSVALGRIFLAKDNPRHVTYETENKVIEYLCEKEGVYALARDIAKNGLNPLERFALIPIGSSKQDSSTQTYTVAEGNRRICALKLLTDPERAPANLRKAMEKLSAEWKPIKTVPAAIFKNIEEVNLWLDRVHNGAQGGIGRRDWNAEQKQRFDGGSKNRAAQALLDYAESEKMLTAEERKGKLTTAQRFLGNDVFREMLGLDISNPDDISRNRPKSEFDILVKRFIHDLVDKKHVHSRMNKAEIIEYARPLGSLAGITTARDKPESLKSQPSRKPSTPKPTKPRHPDRAKHIRHEADIASGLKTLGADKLVSLYHSICTIDLDPHTPIVAVGAWSFLETLTALAGRHEGTSFDNFLSKTKLQSLGVTGETVSLRAALSRMREYGNTTKHHPIAATFNGDQLNNDMVALKGVILACIQEAISKSI